MHDAGKVIIGIIIFLVLVTFPIWFAIAGGRTGEMPELAKPVHGDDCVLPSEEMKETHMFLLDDWRDEVVRDNDRWYTAFDGQIYEKSLTRTCLDCHASKADFCDRCHNYLEVSPYCWDCHINPEEIR